MMPTPSAAKKPATGKARVVVHRTRTWPVPSTLSFGAGLENIVRTSKPLAERAADIASSVTFTVATTTMGGEPIQAQLGLLNIANLDTFQPRPDSQQRAIERLVSEGCSLVRKGRFSVSMSAPAKLVEDLIGQPLVLQAMARRSPLRSTHMFAADFQRPARRDLFAAPQNTLSVPGRVDDVDHLVFIPPPLYFAPSPTAPATAFHAVDEARIRKLLNVPASASAEGIRVALVDTGFHAHPYYDGLKYMPVPTVSAPKPGVDEDGHGTAIAYNVFAVAPGVEVMGFKHTDPPQDAIEDAAEANADIISCSWGYDREQIFPVLQASLLSVIRDGKIVLFASGNGHYAWPGSEPDVLSVGGVYWNEEEKLEASNYASGYMSGMFANRMVPDVSALCGQAPKAVYIMMPTQPGSKWDRDLGGTTFPDGDDTARDDGWAGLSGTSSAAPQVAGIVALMLHKARAKGKTLSPQLAKDILKSSCVSVQAGRNAMGFPAIGQPNVAVGHGLVDATAALAQI